MQIVEVAPHAGALIEMSHLALCVGTPLVAPHAGAWIEMCGFVGKP